MVLHDAINNLAAIQAFLKHGISPNACMKGSSLLLTSLLENGPNEISDYLISQGATIIDNGTFESCEERMMHKSHNGLTKAIELYSLHKTNERGSNYLHSACSKKDLNIVQQILASKYKDELLHQKNKFKYTPFLCAISQSEQIADILLAAGANINDADDIGSTSLLLCCVNEDDQVFKFLIERNADVNLADNNGWVFYIDTANSNL